MENRDLNIKIILRGVDGQQFTELKQFCEYNPFLSLNKVQSLGGAEDAIISLIFDELQSTSFSQLIIGWVAGGLFTFLGNMALQNTSTLIIKGRKYVGLKLDQIEDKLRLYIARNCPVTIDIFDLINDYIKKYNNTFNQSIVLRKESILDEKYLQIDLEDNNIYINKKIFVYLSSYYFGSSKLSHLYKLSNDLLQMGFIDEASEILSKFDDEWKDVRDRMKHYILTNPLWIINQVAISVLHEFGHHQISLSPEEYKEEATDIYNIAILASEMMFANINRAHTADFFKRNIVGVDENKSLANNLASVLPLIERYASSIIEKILSDNKFIEELQADFFSFNWMIEIASMFKSNQAIAEILASLIGNSNYIVACEVLNSFTINPINSSSADRLELGAYNHIATNLRAAVRDFIMLPYIEELKKDGISYEFFSNLISYPFLENNCKIDVDFLKSIDKYYIIMRRGHKTECNENLRNIIENKISQFDDNIIQMLSNGIKVFKSGS